MIDSFFENAQHDAKPLWFLTKLLELLATADIAFFAEDGKNTVVVRLNISVLCSTGLKLYAINNL